MLTIPEALTKTSRELSTTLSTATDKLLVTAGRASNATHENKGGYGEYVFIDNGAKVLAVAHCDTVQEAFGKREYYTFVKQNGKMTPLIRHPNLDDRLGVYTIMYLLPLLGIKTDILLTNDEETGRSTATEFSYSAHKDYNWIVEFDRAGHDVVTYQFDNAKWERAIRDSGFTIGFGSYSDISDLGSLGASAFNVGVGYQNYHRQDAYANLWEYTSNIEKFVNFYFANKSKQFPHEEYTYSKYYSPRRYSPRSYYGAYGDEDYSLPYKYSQNSRPTCDTCEDVIRKGKFKVYVKYEEEYHSTVADETFKYKKVARLCPTCALSFHDDDISCTTLSGGELDREALVALEYEWVTRSGWRDTLDEEATVIDDNEPIPLTDDEVDLLSRHALLEARNARNKKRDDDDDAS